MSIIVYTYDSEGVMYYFSEEKTMKQFDNAKDYCLKYATFLKEKYPTMSSETLTQMIEYLRENFKLIDGPRGSNDAERLAKLLSEKQGSAEDFADFILLLLYQYDNIKATKFSIVMANRDAVAGIKGSATNPIYHFGIVFRIDGQKVFGEQYLDINMTMDKMAPIQYFSNRDIRVFFNQEFYFSMISRINDFRGETLELYYDDVIKNGDTAKPKSCV